MKSIKKICTLLIMLLAICTFSVSALARDKDDADTYVIDDAGLLSSSEKKSLEKELKRISQKYDVDVTVVTTDYCYASDMQSFADDVYEQMDFGFGSKYDGVMLLISMDVREYQIHTEGFGIKAYTDDAVEYLGDEIKGYLSSGKYAKAFDKYAELSEDFIKRARDGKPYKKPFNWVKSVVISFAIAFLIGILYVLGLYSQLKSVKKQYKADDYTKPGSMQVNICRDLYLYNKIERTKKVEQSSGGSTTHITSSGRTAGGGGGKF